MTTAIEVAPAVESAARVPGPPELLPGRPDAVVDLQTADGAALVGGQWRYANARMEEIDFVELAGQGAPDPLGPGTVPNRTYDVVPHAQAVDFDDSDWERLAPADTMRRLSSGRVCFNWYRIDVTIPERVGTFDPTGATIVFEVTIDDYAEVWVNGEMPLALGLTGGQVVTGFNAPNRVVLTRDAQPGRSVRHRRVRHQRPDLGLAGELHLDAHRHARLLRTGARTPRPNRVRARRHARTGRRGLRVHGRSRLVARRGAAVQLAEHEHDLPAGPRRRHA